MQLLSKLKIKHCIVFWALIGVGFIAPLAQKIQDPDFWWHLKTGQVITHNLSLPTSDIYSFTAAGREWITHEWLSEVVFYLTYCASGLAGILTLKAILLFLTTLVLYILVVRRTGNIVISAAAAAYLIIAICTFWSERPQLFSYLFLVSLIYLIDNWRKGGSIYWAVPLFVLWINMHGVWIAGYALLCLVLLEDVIISIQSQKRSRVVNSVIAWIAVTAALFINPIGIKLVTYPLQYAGVTYHTKYIQEWRPPNLHTWEHYPNLLLIGIIPLLAIWGRARCRVSEWLIVIIPGVASLFSVRHAPLFALMSAPLIGTQLSAILKKQSPRVEKPESPLFNVVLISTLAALIIIKLPFLYAENALIIKSEYPIKAVNYLNSRDVIGSGRLMSVFDWGGYLIYNLYPRYKVSIDGRADVYGKDLMDTQDRLEMLYGNWKKDLKEYNPDVILWSRKLKLSKRLPGMQEWKIIYKDKMSVIYCRKELKHASRASIDNYSKGIRNGR